MAKKTETRPSTGHINPFGLRMQPELRSRLEAAAANAGRSLNAEIVARLESSLDGKDDGVQGLALRAFALGALASTVDSKLLGKPVGPIIDGVDALDTMDRSDLVVLGQEAKKLATRAMNALDLAMGVKSDKESQKS